MTPSYNDPWVKQRCLQNFKWLFLLSILAILSACSHDLTHTDNPDTNIRVDEEALAARNPWHRAKLNGVAFRAIGQEPGWLLEITTGEQIELTLNYGQDHYRYPYTVPREYKKESRTVFDLVPVDNQPAGQVELRDEPCIDTMSGEPFQVMVILTFDNLLYQGCGQTLL